MTENNTLANSVESILNLEIITLLLLTFSESFIQPSLNCKKLILTDFRNMARVFINNVDSYIGEQLAKVSGNSGSVFSSFN